MVTPRDFRDAWGTPWHQEPDGAWYFWDSGHTEWAPSVTPPAEIPPAYPPHPEAPRGPGDTPSRTAEHKLTGRWRSPVLAWTVAGVLAVLLVITLATERKSPPPRADASVATTLPVTPHRPGTPAAPSTPVSSTAGTPATNGTATSIQSSPATTNPPPSSAPGAVSQQNSTSTTAPTTADVTITRCAVDAKDSSLGDVGGNITNHSSQTSTYSISVALVEGSLQVGEADDAVNAIATGQSSTWSANGRISGGNGQALTCRIAGVDRIPSP